MRPALRITPLTNIRKICAQAATSVRALRRVLFASFGLLLSAYAPVTHAQDPTPGSLDTSPAPGFAAGTGKIASLAIGTGYDQANAVVLQADGKIVLAGYCYNGAGYDFCVARLNANGTLDTSFDGPSGTGNGKFFVPVGTGASRATAAAQQTDGKLVLAGYCAGAGNDDFCVARLNANGTLDVSFVGPAGNGNGKFLLPIGTLQDQANAIALQPDGKIVLAGTCFNGSNNDFCVARLNPDGALDASFVGPSGTGNGAFLLPIGATSDQAMAVAIQSDGKIVLAGYCSNGSNNDFCVARLNADGMLDTSFDGPSGNANGMFLLPIGLTSDQATALAIQPDGKLVLAGNCSNGSEDDFCVARLNTNGTYDSNFDGPSGTGDGKFLLPIGTSVDRATAVAIQPDGKIVLAGTCNTVTNEDFCVARLTAEGALDTTFDGPSGSANGAFIQPMATNADRATGMVLQPDGKIVVAGYCAGAAPPDFCVARFNGGPFGAKNCTPDFDGDGKILATTDALILARVALGMTGSAVISGISFASNSTRQTWPAIRDYLVTQCGMVIAP